MAKKINFLILAYSFDESFGVGAVRSRSIVSFLTANGYSYEVVQQRGRSKILWSLRAFWKILSSSNDYIYLSLGPFFPLLFAPLLSLLFCKKIIVDFRDPLSQNQVTGYGGTKKPSILKIYSSIVLEKICYLCAHEIWVCTPGMKDYFKQLFGSESKLFLVTNGFTYTPDNLETSCFSAEPSCIRYICLGKFAEINTTTARAYLESISLRHPAKKIQVLLVGSSPASNKPLRDSFPHLDIKVIEKLPVKKALALASTCDFGIVLLRNDDIEFGTKVFEYLGIGLQPFGIFDKNKNFYKFFKTFLDAEKGSLPSAEQFRRDAIWEHTFQRLYSK